MRCREVDLHSSFGRDLDSGRLCVPATGHLYGFWATPLHHRLVVAVVRAVVGEDHVGALRAGEAIALRGIEAVILNSIGLMSRTDIAVVILTFPVRILSTCLIPLLLILKTVAWDYYRF